MLTEKPEHMTDEEWSAFNDDEMGEAPKAKYEDAEVKLDDDVEALLTPDTEKDENHNKANDDVVEFLNLDDIEIPDITGAVDVDGKYDLISPSLILYETYNSTGSLYDMLSEVTSL